MADDERTTSTSAITHPTTEDGSGLGRRQAIGLFGGAAAAAWVAPQIISVPAASAATVAPGGPAASVAVGVGGTVIVEPIPSSGAPAVANAVPPSGWTSVGPIAPTTLNGIANNRLGSDSTWVAVGAGGQAFVSTDSTATTWTPHVTPTESTLRAITWTGSEFVAVGDGGVVIRSSDGTSWSTVFFSSPQSPAFRGVASDGTTIVAVGDDGAVISALTSNLSSWTTESSGATGTLQAVAAGQEGIFVAVGVMAPLQADFPIVVRAVDGTWSGRASDLPGAADDLYAVAVGATGAAVGAGGSSDAGVVRSQDPPDYTPDWTASGPVADIEPIRGMAALPEVGFVLVGQNGQIAVLDSDFQLNGVPSPTTSDLNAVATA